MCFGCFVLFCWVLFCYIYLGIYTTSVYIIRVGNGKQMDAAWKSIVWMNLKFMVPINLLSMMLRTIKLNTYFIAFLVEIIQ